MGLMGTGCVSGMIIIQGKYCNGYISLCKRTEFEGICVSQEGALGVTYVWWY